MKRIHVLTAGFTTPNGQAFLMPLLLHRRSLAEAGLSVRLFDEPAAGLSPVITDPSATWDADRTFPAAHLLLGEHRRG